MGSLITGGKLILDLTASGLIPARPQPAAPTAQQLFAQGRQIGSAPRDWAGRGRRLQFAAWRIKAGSGRFCFTAFACRSCSSRWRNHGSSRCGAAGAESGSPDRGQRRAHLGSWGEGLKQGQARRWLDAGVCLSLAGGGLDHGLQGDARANSGEPFAPVAAQKGLRRLSSLRRLRFLAMALRRPAGLRWGCGTAAFMPQVA